MIKWYLLSLTQHLRGLFMTFKFKALKMRDRFRSYLPIVIDVETAGVNPQADALLEIGMVFIEMDKKGFLHPGQSFHEHVLPFAGANLNPDSLAFNKIDPYHPFRYALTEQAMFDTLIPPIKRALKSANCTRAVLVGHNAWFDLLFLKQAIMRCQINSPFHGFTCFDTATLAAAHFGQTVLAKALNCAKIPFDLDKAHSALYDAEKTAELFCQIINEG